MADSVLKRLLDESRDLERRAEQIQGDRDLQSDDESIDQFVADYHDWYARAIDALPGELEERFRDAFDGGTFTSKIKAFLRGPGDVSPLFDPDAPNPFVDHWSNPFDTTFRGPVLDQRQILAEARQQLEGPGKSSQDLLLIERICRNLPEFLEPLAKRGRNRAPLIVEDEYDLQLVVHALLRLFFDDVRPEDYVADHAGSRSRVDFLLKAERIVLETKMTRRGLGSREVGEELIVDIERYKRHPDCEALVALVFDPDRLIKNRRAIEHDLSRKHDGLPVRVYVVQ
ncbi:MAG: hypothetical protein QOG93_1861 [Gaiellaceae bacterium]|nr:hypothetical protein [Gaiellaceae bacterium]